MDVRPAAPRTRPLPESDEENLLQSRAPALPRFTCQLTVGERTLEGPVSNLSLDGLFLPTGSQLRDGTEVHFQLAGLAERPISGRGRVAWSGRGPLDIATTPGLGVRFVELYEGHDRLRSFTRQRFDLLKARHVPIESIVPLVFFPTEKLPFYRGQIGSFMPAPMLEEAIAAYSEIGMKHRRRFIWQFTRLGCAVETLPGVDPALFDLVNDIKTLGVMVDVLLDDLADEARDRHRLERLIGLLEYRTSTLGVRPPRTGDPYDDFGVEVWDRMWSLAEQLPRYAEFAPLLRFDWQQLFLSMRYAQLLSDLPQVQNLPEQDTYIPHSMHMLCNATLDLMCSPRFDLDELPVTRRATRVAQRMGCIANTLTTWERELDSSDLSSGVFGYAFHRRILSHEEARALPKAEVAARIRAAHLERYFLLDFENLRAYLSSLRDECKSVDLGRFAASLDELLMMHLSGKGLM